MNSVPCPSCGLIEDWPENPLKPYCSEVCRLLWRHGLAWRIQPYRIVFGTHPHLVVQAGPRFDMRESALTGAKQRALETDRKRRQRSAAKVRNVPPMEGYKTSVQGSFAILGVKKLAEASGSQNVANRDMKMESINERSH